MEDTMFVLMLKDRETGFLEKEIGCYQLDGREKLLSSLYACDTEEGCLITMGLCCGRDVSDWEFNAIFDYYDLDVLAPYVLTIEEDISCYNPSWVVRFPFLPQTEAMEQKLNMLLELHEKELFSVYEAIVLNREDYIDEDEKEK